MSSYPSGGILDVEHDRCDRFADSGHLLKELNEIFDVTVETNLHKSCRKTGGKVGRVVVVVGHLQPHVDVVQQLGQAEA